MLFLAGCLHVSWFRGGLAGYIKRRRVSPIPGVQDTTLNETVIDPLVDDAMNTEPSEEATTSPPTPEDSPLMTPQTPSIIPFSLRDTYLPTLAIPNLPLPKLSRPTLPGFSDLNTGFKDAVKHHWEDRRAVLGGMGVGINLNLGGLGLRRRGTKEVRGEVAEVRVEEVSLED